MLMSDLSHIFFYLGTSKFYGSTGLVMRGYGYTTDYILLFSD